MRFTRLSKPILGAGIGCVLSCAIVSCAETDDSGDSAPLPGDRTGSDVPPPAEPDASDASSAERDAARIHPSFDAAPPPLDCESDPCAVSLTTRGTFGYEMIPPGGSGYVTRKAGASFCALLRDGTVACWGANDGAQLGRGDDANSWGSPNAMRVAGLSKIVQLEGTCAVDKDGAAWCWSYGPYRSLDTSPVHGIESSPVKLALDPVKKVAVGSFWASWVSGCAVLVDGGVVCWGANLNGVVASTNITRNSVLPVQRIPLPSEGRARDIGVGTAAVVLMDDGSLVSWGDNPTLGRATSLAPNPYPGPIAIAGVANAFDVRQSEACATAWGAGYCWGAGTATNMQSPITYFDLDNLERALPSPIASPEPVRQISTPGARQGCAVGGSGAVYCWGDNTYGQVGDGTRDYAAKPARVAGLPAAAVEVKAAGDSTCALLVNGKVYCWGADQYGQLGNGALYQPSVLPQEVTLP